MAQSQMVGATGEYYVAYELSARNLITCITVGNSPNIDILVSNEAGLKTISIQVKTSRNAWRNKRYGHEGYEWDVNAGVIGKQSLDFWYAFVDLQENENTYNPKVFIVPSKWVAEFVLPGWSRNMYFLPKIAEDLCLNRWDLINGILNNDQDVINFASHWPEEKLVRWGV